MKTYSILLRVIALTTIVCFSMMIVMMDVNEEREPWEFVPVQTK